MSSENPIGADNQQETISGAVPRNTKATQVVAPSGSTGILRDYTRGPLSDNGEDIVRSSWRHGEPSRNDSVPQEVFCGVTRMPKVAKFLVG
jgi:hypothetical protein